MDSDEDDLYGQDDHEVSNSRPPDGATSGEVKMEDLEEGEEEGEEVEEEDSDDVGPFMALDLSLLIWTQGRYQLHHRCKRGP
jgi:hypothetical protein